MQHVYWVVEKKLAGRPGPLKHPWDPFALNEAGIGGIVSLDGPVVTKHFPLAGLMHLAIVQPMILLETETQRQTFLEVIPPAFQFIDEINLKDQGVIIHCHHGRDRTGAVLACWLVARAGLSATDAIAQVRELKSDAMIAPGYAEAVELFETQFRDNPLLFGPIL